MARKLGGGGTRNLRVNWSTGGLPKLTKRGHGTGRQAAGGGAAAGGSGSTNFAGRARAALAAVNSRGVSVTARERAALAGLSTVGTAGSKADKDALRRVEKKVMATGHAPAISRISSSKANNSHRRNENANSSAAAKAKERKAVAHLAVIRMASVPPVTSLGQQDALRVIKLVETMLETGPSAPRSFAMNGRDKPIFFVKIDDYPRK
jgi:hypothetical protein